MLPVVGAGRPRRDRFVERDGTLIASAGEHKRVGVAAAGSDNTTEEIGVIAALDHPGAGALEMPDCAGSRKNNMIA